MLHCCNDLQRSTWVGLGPNHTIESNMVSFYCCWLWVYSVLKWIQALVMWCIIIITGEKGDVFISSNGLLYCFTFQGVHLCTHQPIRRQHVQSPALTLLFCSVVSFKSGDDFMAATTQRPVSLPLQVKGAAGWRAVELRLVAGGAWIRSEYINLLQITLIKFWSFTDSTGSKQKHQKRIFLCHPSAKLLSLHFSHTDLTWAFLVTTVVFFARSWSVGLFQHCGSNW